MELTLQLFYDKAFQNKPSTEIHNYKELNQRRIQGWALPSPFWGTPKLYEEKKTRCTWAPECAAL